MIAGLTPEELLHEALVAPRQTRSLNPDTEVISSSNWYQLVTPSFREGGFNEVAFARLGDDEVESVIDATLARYAALGLRFRWTVTPECRPLDLADRLARRGLRPDRCLVMAAAVADLELSAASDIVIEPVDHDNVEVHAEVTARGWGVDPAPLLAYQRRILADVDEGRHHLFLARLGGTPVGIGNYTALARSGFLVGAVVLPEHRSRGVYRALLAARVRHAAARGLALVTTHARAETSAPILARLGFVTVADLPVFFNR